MYLGLNLEAEVQILKYIYVSIYCCLTWPNYQNGSNRRIRVPKCGLLTNCIYNWDYLLCILKMTIQNSTYYSLQGWVVWKRPKTPLRNIKMAPNFSLELKQSKTPPAASCWIISTLVRRFVFFNPRLCKSWDCPNSVFFFAIQKAIQHSWRSSIDP